MIKFNLECVDVADVESDMLLLKYAQKHYGADEQIANLLHSRGVSIPETMPAPGDYRIVETNGCIAPRAVMFLGTPPPYAFDYLSINEFARRASEILIAEGLPVTHVTTTIHGVGFGLDPCESLEQLVLGIVTEAASGNLGTLQNVTIIDRSRQRYELLSRYLRDNEEKWRIPSTTTWGGPAGTITGTILPGSADAANPPVQPKGHVFAAMPYSEEFEDVYEFGIYASVRKLGYACEHVGEAAFTGDVLQRITRRIETAELVVADLTGARPNVYLEVGYAWGREIPTIIIAREGEDLHFDVSRHKCLFYRNIKHLAKALTSLIEQLQL